jgi:hypothetical protein
VADSQADQNYCEQNTSWGIDLTEGDVDKLLSRSKTLSRKSMAEVQAILEKSVYLYYTNLKKDIKNLEMLGKLATPENQWL